MSGSHGQEEVVESRFMIKNLKVFRSPLVAYATQTHLCLGHPPLSLALLLRIPVLREEDKPQIAQIS